MSESNILTDILDLSATSQSAATATPYYGMPDRNLRVGEAIAWDQAFLNGRDWSTDTDLLGVLAGADGVVFHNLTLAGVDSLFRLRALQLLAPERSAFTFPAVIHVVDPDFTGRGAPGLRQRIESSWPFGSVLFVATGLAANWLEAEGLPVVRARVAQDALLNSRRALSTHASPEQKVALHIQSLWPWAGSSTAFLNQIECLVERGYFVIRVFTTDRIYGDSAATAFAEYMPANRVHAAPHLETLICPPLRFARQGASEYDIFVWETTWRADAMFMEAPLRKLAPTASVVYANLIFDVVFARKNAPQAALILDTHDFLTRYHAYRRRGSHELAAFPKCGVLRRALRLEYLLWGVADVCIAVNQGELGRIKRMQPNSLCVLPKPYARPWKSPGTHRQWDIAFVADANPYAMASIEWFLERVVDPSEKMRKLRIGIGGNVKHHLERKWASRLPNVQWLGFVDDLDQLAGSALLSINPDRMGTGVSVKSLTMFRAGQPFVATRDSMRGLGDSVYARIPTHESAASFAGDILTLLDDSANLEERRERVAKAGKRIWESTNYGTAIDLAIAPNRVPSRTRQHYDAAVLQLARDRAQHKPPRSRNFFGVRKVDLSRDGDADACFEYGWHHKEDWGRWTNGAHAVITLPRSWVERGGTIALLRRDRGDFGRTGIKVSVGGRQLAPVSGFCADDKLVFEIEPDQLEPGRAPALVLDVHVSNAFYPNKAGLSDDRLLGADVTTLLLATRGTFPSLETYFKLLPVYARLRRLTGAGRGRSRRSFIRYFARPSLKKRILRLDGRAFVEACFGTMLLRPADDSGMTSYLRALDEGMKRELILLEIQMSPEGRTKKWQQPRPPISSLLLWKMLRTPVLGRWLRRRGAHLERFDFRREAVRIQDMFVGLSSKQDRLLEEVARERDALRAQTEALQSAIRSLEFQLLSGDREESQSPSPQAVRHRGTRPQLRDQASKFQAGDN